MQRYTFLVNKQKKKKRDVNSICVNICFFSIFALFINTFSHLYNKTRSYFSTLVPVSLVLHPLPSSSFLLPLFSPRFSRGASMHTQKKQKVSLSSRQQDLLRCVRGSNS